MLELKAISKDFGRKKLALNNVNFALTPGFTALIGPNGGGKSTLMGIATTLQKPTRGEVLWNGAALRGSLLEEYRRQISYVPQRINLINSMSLIDTMDYVGWTARIAKNARLARAKDLLERFDLSHKQAQKVGSLSGGQLRRLGIATAMMNAPKILFLDEPTVGLDPEARLRTREIIASIANEATVLMSTHLVEDIQFLPGKLSILANGEIVYQGDYHDLASKVPAVTTTMGSSFEVAYGAIIEEVKRDY